MKEQERFDALMREFKGGRFLYGEGCLPETAKLAGKFGSRALLVRSGFAGINPFVHTLESTLKQEGIQVVKEMTGVIRPNAPVEDMLTVKEALEETTPDLVISFGGGSVIDAVKAAVTLYCLGREIDDYFGVGKVTEALSSSGKTLVPHIAVQTAASSAAHLTKYSNITFPENRQKKLIVDEAIVPDLPVFDYSLSYQEPESLTLDGALDGLSHCMEVFFGSVNTPRYEKAKEIASLAIGLIVSHLPQAIQSDRDKEARIALCMATDLGGYAIMIGGTSGAHLTSFSLVDLLPHGRACALMNPYYTVFYAPAIEEPLRILGNIYKSAGYSTADFDRLSGRSLGIAFAEAMLQFAEHIGFPTRLSQVDGFSKDYIYRALEAAKNPQLRSKLENMPVPLKPEQVDEYMGSILHAAESGDVTMIKNL